LLPIFINKFWKFFLIIISKFYFRLNISGFYIILFAMKFEYENLFIFLIY
jgi:hypothetical protein